MHGGGNGAFNSGTGTEQAQRSNATRLKNLTD
jgi:hypothetical protein